MNFSLRKKETKKEPKKEQNHNETTDAADGYAYHWSYADYQLTIKEKLGNTGTQWKRWISFLAVCIIVLLSVFITMLHLTLHQREETDVSGVTGQIDTSGNTVSNALLLQNDDYIARCIDRYRSASLRIVNDAGNVTGFGFLMDNGYILTDITALLSSKPSVIDADGNHVTCTVLLSDLTTHLAVLLPDKTISARGLAVSTVAFTGQSVYLVGYYPSDTENIVAEFRNINYQNDIGQVNITGNTESMLKPLSVICDLNMQIIGAYTTNSRFEMLDQLSEQIENARQKLIESAHGFEEYKQVDFANETSYETVPYESAALYHVPTGIRLKTVVAGSAAEAAGFSAGDIFNTIEGKIIKNTADFESALASVSGPFYSVSVYRDGKYYDVKLRTMTAP